MRNKAFFKYIFALLLFGSNGVVASFIDLDSQSIVFLRTLIGSMLLIIIFFAGGGKPSFYQCKRSFLFLTASGIAMGISWMLLYEGYTRIGVGVASLLYYCGPIIIMVLSPWLFGERLTVNKVIGFIAVLFGVVMINGTALEGNADVFGIVCASFSAVMYAFMVVCNKKVNSINGLENSTFQLIAAFLTTAVFVGLKQGYAMQITPSSILPILVLGLLNTGMGCYFYFSAIRQLKVQTVAVFGYLEPLSAVLFSVMILKESMLPLQIIGVACIIGGAILAEAVKFGKGKRKSNKKLDEQE